MPEPQMPVTPVRRVEAANPVSSDQRLEPMTRKRGSRVTLSMRTRSIAPGAARWPLEICAPSNAGPVGEDAASSRSREPSTISAFVPTSTRSVTSSARYGVSARIAPAASAPTCPAMHGSTYTRAPACAGSSSSRARTRTAASVASANGAEPERHRVDAEQEVVHDRVAHDRELEDLLDLDAGPRREPGDEARDRVANGAGHRLRAALVHHRVRDAAHEVLAEPDLRVHHAVGGEDLAVGEIREVPGDRRRPDVDRDAERPIVQARPDAGDGPAVVDRDRDAVAARLERRLEGADHLEVRLEARRGPTPARARRAGGRGRRRASRGPAARPRPRAADDGVDDEVADRHALADDLAMDLALGRHVDEDVAADRCPSSRAAGRRRGRAAGRTRPRPRRAARGGRRSSRCRASGTSPRRARPGSGRTGPRPPHTESRSTPSERAASRTVVPGSNRPRRPDGVKMTCGIRAGGSCRGCRASRSPAGRPRRASPRQRQGPGG